MLISEKTPFQHFGGQQKKTKAIGCNLQQQAPVIITGSLINDERLTLSPELAPHLKMQRLLDILSQFNRIEQNACGTSIQTTKNWIKTSSSSGIYKTRYHNDIYVLLLGKKKL